MAFVYRDPFAQLQSELEHMLEGAFAPTGVYPPVNVFDAGDAWVVKAEIPGVAPEQIEVHVEDDILVLRGERKVQPPGEDGAFHRRERGQGQFRRLVRLPGPPAAEETRADYKDGVLTVRMVKAKDRRPHRVSIQAA
jgi:HSP20 family protein